MRIPTLLALAILTLAIFGGVVLYMINHNLISSSPIAQPKEIGVSNITDSSATVTWQTDNPATGLVSWGDSDSLGNSASDSRDSDNPFPHLNHLVTLRGLKPSTKYFFKVKSNTQFYPDNNLTFTTGPTLQNQPKTKPLFGVVVDKNLRPADEALVILKISGAQVLSTLTNATGNFILPLVTLRKGDLSDYFLLNKTAATLLISLSGVDSQVTLQLPSGDTPLPKITLGENLDASQSAIASPSASPKVNYDLNSDGKVNANDIAILLLNFGKKQGDPKFNPNYDLNSDGVIDQKDLDILKKAIR